MNPSRIWSLGGGPSVADFSYFRSFPWKCRVRQSLGGSLASTGRTVSRGPHPRVFAVTEGRLRRKRGKSCSRGPLQPRIEDPGEIVLFSSCRARTRAGLSTTHIPNTSQSLTTTRTHFDVLSPWPTDSSAAVAAFPALEHRVWGWFSHSAGLRPDIHVTLKVILV